MCFVPQGMSQDGYPVIVFPKKSHAATRGKLYDFDIQVTNSATYVLDGQTYRVAHAHYLQDVQGTEGDFIDEILHASSDSRRPKLGDASPQLAALRQLMLGAST